jgi:hypothetical protein
MLLGINFDRRDQIPLPHNTDFMDEEGAPNSHQDNLNASTSNSVEDWINSYDNLNASTPIVHLNASSSNSLESERPFKEGLHPEASGRVLRQRNRSMATESKKAINLQSRQGYTGTPLSTPLSTCIGEASEFVDKVREELERDLDEAQTGLLDFGRGVDPEL